MSRDDVHRPSAIVPADYEAVRDYHISSTLSGYPIPSFGIDCEMAFVSSITRERVVGKHGTGDRCCIARLRAAGYKFADVGGIGRCSICGACFVYGEVFRHKPTGELVHMGHECAAKYQIMADRSESDMALGRAKAQMAREIQTKVNAEERAAFLAGHAGLAEALETKHRIVEAIAEKFRTYRNLTDKQIALVFKLAAEAKMPAKPEEKNIPAPVGKETFRGKVVSIKCRPDPYAPWKQVSKATIKVTTDDGVWLAWGSVPSLKDDFVHVGDELEIKATLQAGRDAHFVFMKRPRATLIVRQEVA